MVSKDFHTKSMKGEVLVLSGKESKALIQHITQDESEPVVVQIET